MPGTPAPDYCRAHHTLAQDFAQRHFTDPDVTIADAAAFAGVDPRTLTRSLGRCNTSWRAMLHRLRLTRAQELLATKLSRAGVAGAGGPTYV
jgi:transcriptional regulator GlxA family with amidase domain